MASLIPLTELEAVNLMLETIGEAPVSTLVDVGIQEVAIASSILHNTSRNVQSLGHTFNNETNYPLLVDSNNEITLPSNTLRVKPMDNLNIIQRGNRLYDKTNHSYTFDTIDQLLVDITFFLPFEELPQAVRQYVYVAASRDFQKKVLGSDTITSFTQEDEARAMAAFMDEEADVGNWSIFSSYDTARPILRNSNPVPRGMR